MNAIFECNQCGACCKSINLSEETIFLNRGDGVCRYFDDFNNTCTIYDNRPAVCNVRVMYEKRYKNQFSWSEFTRINKLACSALFDRLSKKANEGIIIMPPCSHR